MSLRLSTGLRQALLGSSDLKDVFTAFFIDIYSGLQPSSADAAPTGTKLCTFFNDGVATGLNFDPPVAGVISKKSTETWSGTAVATGTAGWFRVRLAADTGALSTTDKRLDGACSTSGAELNGPSLAIQSGAVQTINTFALTEPAQ